MIDNIIKEKIEGYNIIYAKKNGIPKNNFFKSRVELVEFIVYNVIDMEFLSINDVIIDRNKLVAQSKPLMRYLKLKNLYEI